MEIYKVEIYTRQVFTEPLGAAKPIKFRGFLIPEYFKAHFYVIDNDGIKVTLNNFRQFNTWKIELLLKVTKLETVEIVEQIMRGSEPYKGHKIFHYPPPLLNPAELNTVRARHFNELQANRVRLISIAVQVAIQSNVYTETSTGDISLNSNDTVEIGRWTLNDKVEIGKDELKKLNKFVVNFSYLKLDGTFYENFAERYRRLIIEGDKTPIKTLQALYYPDKSLKHVQSYATTCRKKGLLPLAEQGKNSPIRRVNKPNKRRRNEIGRAHV